MYVHTHMQIHRCADADAQNTNTHILTHIPVGGGILSRYMVGMNASNFGKIPTLKV